MHERFDEHELTLNDLDLLDNTSCFLTRGEGIAGFVEEWADGEDGVACGLLLCDRDDVLLHVNTGVVLREVVGHIGQCACGLRGLPGDAFEGDDVKIDGHVLVYGIFSVFGDVVENVDIVFERGLMLMHDGEDTVYICRVAFDFGVQAGFGIVNQVAMMLPFDESLERECYEEADGDGGEVKQEIAPAVHGLVGRVDVQQWAPRDQR